MPKMKIAVHTPFMLKHEGEHIGFPAGVQTVEQEIADHWYVKAHSRPHDPNAPDPAAGAGTPQQEQEAAEGQLQARLAEVAETEQRLNQQAADLAARESELAAKADELEQQEESLQAREAALAAAQADIEAAKSGASAGSGGEGKSDKGSSKSKS